MTSDTLNTFFSMSGYGSYVWVAFSLVSTTLWLQCMLIRKRLKNALKTAEQLKKSAQHE